MQQGMADSSGEEILLSVRPSVLNLEWFFNRNKHTYNCVKESWSREINLVLGITLPDNTGCVAWTLDFAKQTATVLMLYCQTIDDVKLLLAGTVAECSKMGFKTLTMWHNDVVDYDYSGKNSCERQQQVLKYVKREMKGQTGVKNGSLSALSMLHKEGNAAWSSNGKWAWY